MLSVTDVKGRAAVIAKNCPATGTATVKLSPVSVTTEIVPPIKTATVLTTRNVPPNAETGRPVKVNFVPSIGESEPAPTEESRKTPNDGFSLSRVTWKPPLPHASDGSVTLSKPLKGSRIEFARMLA